jgi:hypothetical protein
MLGGSLWKIEDCGLIVDKDKALFVSWQEFHLFDLFCMEKMRWTWLTARGPGALAGPSWSRGRGGG